MGATTRERLARSPTDVSWIMEIVHEKTALRRRGGCTCRSVGWPRIWTQNTVEPMRISGTQRDRLDGRTLLTCSYETQRSGEDRDRLAHNPEVAGSNPVPATSGNGPRRLLRGPFSCRLGTNLGTLALLITRFCLRWHPTGRRSGTRPLVLRRLGRRFPEHAHRSAGRIQHWRGRSAR
jgi:hypothetical protein